jgi:hypothetical protein
MSRNKRSASFSEKHPAGTPVDPHIRKAVEAQTKDKRLGCDTAHRIARDLSVQPSQIGIALDLLNLKITRCQLGLFGYQPDAKPVHAAASVDPELAAELRGRALDSQISCLVCWQIANNRKMPRMAVANACEALELKIRPCQLGAF